MSTADRQKIQHLGCESLLKFHSSMQVCQSEMFLNWSLGAAYCLHRHCSTPDAHSCSAPFPYLSHLIPTMQIRCTEH